MPVYVISTWRILAVSSDQHAFVYILGVLICSGVTRVGVTRIGVARGVHWLHLHPPGRRKKLGVIYRENL